MILTSNGDSLVVSVMETQRVSCQ